MHDHPDKVLEVTGLGVRYAGRVGTHQAVRDVTLALEPGEILGIVGESGSGKSSLALGLAGLLPPGGVVEADRLEVLGRAIPLTPDRRARRARRELLGRDIGVVFQDPTASLDPTMTVGRQIAEPLRVHRDLSRSQVRDRVGELLARTGLADVPQVTDRYPHQLSGGQRQRVMIAIGIACDPKIVIADEPTTALDVTVQAEILDLFASLRDDLGIAIIFVSHDLAVVGDLADRVAVMYAGRLVEVGPVDEVLGSARHPYPTALLACAPRLGQGRGPLAMIEGAALGGVSDDLGCAYVSRCPRATQLCIDERPLLTGGDRHVAACFHPYYDSAVDKGERNHG